MNCEILLVTHLKDKAWTEWNLKSIRKFATGFSGLTLVVPKHERAAFEPLSNIVDFALRTHELPGHLGAQTQKCLADVLCVGADFVLTSDSDCCFIEPVTPEDYFVDGKPVMLIEEFSRLQGNPWKPTVDKALGGDAKYETMRRHPQVNPVGLYADMREHIAKRHGMSFEQYTMSQKPDYPWGMSECCWLGSFALNSPWKEHYHWIDVAKDERPKDKLYQAWSHSPPDQMQDLPSGGRGCPLDLYKKLGL